MSLCSSLIHLRTMASIPKPWACVCSRSPLGIESECGCNPYGLISLRHGMNSRKRSSLDTSHWAKRHNLRTKLPATKLPALGPIKSVIGCPMWKTASHNCFIPDVKCCWHTTSPLATSVGIRCENSFSTYVKCHSCSCGITTNSTLPVINYLSA